MLDKMLSSPNAGSIMSKETLNMVASVVSTVAGSSFTSDGSREEAEQVMNLLSTMSAVSYQSMSPGDTPVVFATSNIDVMLQSDYGSMLQDFQINDNPNS